MSDFRGKYAAKKKAPLRPFYPVIGLLIAVLAGAAAWFASPFGVDLVQQYVLSGGGGVPEDQLRIAVAIVVFLIIVAVFAASFSVFQPKTSKLVSEGALKKERENRQDDVRRSKARRKNMQAKMRKANKDWQDI